MADLFIGDKSSSYKIRSNFLKSSALKAPIPWSKDSSIFSILNGAGLLLYFSYLKFTDISSSFFFGLPSPYLEIDPFCFRCYSANLLLAASLNYIKKLPIQIFIFFNIQLPQFYFLHFWTWRSNILWYLIFPKIRISIRFLRFRFLGTPSSHNLYKWIKWKITLALITNGNKYKTKRITNKGFALPKAPLILTKIKSGSSTKLAIFRYISGRGVKIPNKNRFNNKMKSSSNNSHNGSKRLTQIKSLDCR